MCKAGFAGDDAPRAVFRKFCPFVRSPLQVSDALAKYRRHIMSIQYFPDESCQLIIFNSVYRWPSSPSWVILPSLIAPPKRGWAGLNPPKRLVRATDDFLVL